MRRVASSTREKKLKLVVSPDMAVYLVDEEGPRLRALEKDTRRSIEVTDNRELGREEFRILSAQSGRELASEKQN
jgi:hypothetical protein